MYSIIKTNSDNKAFQQLVIELDKELAIRDGDEHAFYDQFNKITTIKHVIVVFEKEIAVGCGALKEYDTNTMEIKRMYVPLDKRGKGIASMILKVLESWAKEMGYSKCILETGVNQPEAIGLYKKNLFTVIPNYGQYTGIENSVCFEKVL
ncbi:GNAT family N-acetyltransferase [Flavobacterium filum]|uniref:GNAT family N-acetyltransferase n=1 Tax=Flavobacterium filum TaxID=370974 RepID=UPI0004031D93|nr:GNAT family N-acetyltransferase [Flavobacterium filum]